jgi:hypothetical protein
MAAQIWASKASSVALPVAMVPLPPSTSWVVGLDT